MVKHRAGVERLFKNDVYRFNIPINGTYYYIAMEGATPMLSFFDALSFQPSTTWQMKEMRREILIKFFIHLNYLLNKWPETQGRAELVLYSSKLFQLHYCNRLSSTNNRHCLKTSFSKM